MKYLVSLILLLTSLNFYSQKVKFGVVGGGNFSTLSGDFEDVIPNERRIGYHLGLFCDFMITNKIGLTPQIIYSSQGFKSPYSESDFPSIDFVNGNPVIGETTIGFEGLYNLNYVNIPIEFKYPIGNNLVIFIGPQIGYLLNAKAIGIISIDGEEEEENSSIDFDTNLDYGASIGLIYKPDNQIFISLKYYQGISNVNSEEDLISGGDESIGMRNSVIQLSLGYVIF